MQEKKTKCKKDLKHKVIEQRSQQEMRNKKSKVLEKLKQDHLEAAESISKLQVQHDIRGRLSAEDEMPGLHHEILSIVILKSGAEEKKRSKVYEVTELEKREYHLKRTTLHYRYDLLYMLFLRNYFISIM